MTFNSTDGLWYVTTYNADGTIKEGPTAITFAAATCGYDPSAFNDLKTKVENFYNTYLTPQDDLGGKSVLQDAIDKINDLVKDNNKEINNIIYQYLTQNITETEIQNIQNTFLKDYYTKTEVTNVLKNYVTNEYLTQNYYNKQEILNLINQYLSPVEEVLNGTIDNIIIQATENPVFGYFNLPADMRSTILFAYFGETENAFKFPTTKTQSYVDEDEAFTQAELDLMGIGSFSSVEFFQRAGFYINEKQGNAGRVFFTVNPTEVSLQGKTFSLVNSRGEESPIKLSTPYESNKLLSFGYDRTRGNKFTMYEAAATLSKDDVLKCYLSINESELKDDVKKVLSGLKKKSVRTMLDAGVEFGKAIWDNVDNTMPAYGVMATWNDSQNQSHTTVSQMNMVASAIKPLSFSTLQPLQGKKFPGMDRLQDFAHRVLEKTFNSLKRNIDKLGIPTITVDDIHFKKINIDHLDDGQLSIKVDVTVEVKGTITKDITVPIAISTTAAVAGGYVYQTNPDGSLATDAAGNPIIIGSYEPISAGVDVNGNATTTLSINVGDYVNVSPHFYVNDEGGGNTFEIDYTDDINDLIDDISATFNDEMDDIEEQLADILEQIRKFNQFSTNIDNALVDYENEIRRNVDKYITKVYDKLNSVIAGRAYRLFDVCMVAHQDGKLALVSMTKRNPTVVNGTANLFATSYTLELFAPAYKKFIAVTRVYNSDLTLPANATSLIQAANQGTNMMQVIDGDKQVKFTGEKGKIYQVSYAAVDYKGQMTRKKFYVKFK